VVWKEQRKRQNKKMRKKTKKTRKNKTPIIRIKTENRKDGRHYGKEIMAEKETIEK
jgi:hypothetical protein